MNISIQSLKNRACTRIFLGGVVLLLGACAAKRPILYPNDHYRLQTESQIDADMKDCMDLANTYVKEPGKYQDIAKSGLTGGAVGAGAGALGGVIVGNNVGRSVGAGAAVGALVAVVNEIIKSNDPSPPYEAFVNHCLAKKGYEVTSWN